MSEGHSYKKCALKTMDIDSTINIFKKSLETNYKFGMRKKTKQSS